MASTEEIVQQLIGSILSDPQSAQTIVEHPYSAVRQVTGKEEVSKNEVSQVISMLGALAGGKTFETSVVEQKAAEELAANNNSVHQMASSIFGSLLGGGTATAAAAPAAQQSNLSMDILSNLANVAFSSGKAGSKINLSDGIGIDDILGIANIAGSIMGSKK